MRKIHVLIVVLCLLTSSSAFAAERLKVVSFTSTDENTAQTQKRLDINAELCALVRIVSSEAISRVEGNFVTDEQGNMLSLKGGETWVYLTGGSKQLRLFPEKHLPLMVNFRDFDIRSLKGGVTYVLTLAEDTGGATQEGSGAQGAAADDNEGNFFILDIKPAEAKVTVDGKPLEREQESGMMSIFLERGAHEMKATAPDCFDQVKTIVIGNDPVSMEIDMKSAAFFFLKYSPAEATLLINGQEVDSDGSGRYIDQLTPGSYTYRLEAKGCQPVERQVTLKQGENSYAEVLPLPAIDTKGQKEGTKKTYTVNGVSFTMILVEGGTFTMGHVATCTGHEQSRYETPHQVTLSPYWIAETEVTRQLYNAVMGIEKEPDDTNDYLIQNPTVAYDFKWAEAYVFLNRLRELTGVTFRMPTEAQWEYAAKGGKNSNGYEYAGSKSPDKVSLYDAYHESIYAHPVKTKRPNELGLYDMSGNLDEWTYDSGRLATTGEAATNPLRLVPTGRWFDGRVVRGGSHWTEAEYTAVCYPRKKHVDGDSGLRLAIY